MANNFYNCRFPGLPDFLCRMRKATLDYQNRKIVDSKSATADIVEEKPVVIKNNGASSERDIDSESEVKDNNTKVQREGQKEKESGQVANKPKTARSNDGDKNTEDTEEKSEDKRESVLGPTPDEERGFLHYFLPFRLFA